MTVSELVSAVKQYNLTLTVLEKAATTHPSPQQVLNVLIARDEVRAVLTAKTQNDEESLMVIILLDQRLKKQAGLITKIVHLAEWRASLHPSPEAWWWFLQPPIQRWDHLDGLWSALSVTSLTATLSLVVDISTRFLSGGPDTLAAFAVISQSCLTLLAAGGVLTTAGRQAIESLLKKLKIPKHFWHETSFGFAGLLLLCTIAFRLSLPEIAKEYNKKGLEDYRAGRLTSALFNFNRAIKLNPDDFDAHYYLGSLYDTELFDYDRASAEYQLAVQAGNDKAYNNLARIYILQDKKYDAAVTLLLDGLNKVRDKDVRYSLHKNLGWVRLKQKRYAEAKAELQEAIELGRDKAPAYCLLAQVLEGQNKKKNALSEWEKCLNLASSDLPDEDNWMGIAQERLKGEK
jgi:tetratricopeptide (TPR) repeat protein